MGTDAATELQRKDKVEKQKKYEKEKSFLQLTEKHLDRDVHNAHIYCAFAFANPIIAFASSRRRLV